MNIYTKALSIGVVAVMGAYVLNILFSWNEDANLAYWAVMLVAFVVGSFIGLKIDENRKKKS